MPFIKTNLPGLLIFEPVVFEDSRGYFFESYNEEQFSKEGIHIKFVQDNQSKIFLRVDTCFGFPGRAICTDKTGKGFKWEYTGCSC